MSDGTAHGLKRQLSAIDVAVMGIAGALGTGLFLGSRDVLAVAGPSAIASYVLTAILGFTVMMAMGELTAAHPDPGGFGAASTRYLGRTGGFIARWNIAICCCIAVGAEVIATSGYLHIWLPQLPLVVLAAVVAVGVIAMNFLAVKAYGTVESVMTFAKVGVVVAFIAIGVGILVSRSAEGVPALTNLTVSGGFLPHGLRGLALGAVLAMFSFGGLESASVAAAESEDPARTIPRAFRMMMITIMTIYVAAMAIITLLTPWTLSVQKTPGISSSPFVEVLSRTGVPGAASIMVGVLIVAAVSAALGLMYAGSRMLYSLGADGLAPRSWAQTNPRGVPVRAVLVSSIGAIIAVLLALFRPDDAFQVLLGILIISVTVTWVMVLLTHLRFRASGTPIPEGIRLRGAPVTTLIALVVTLAMAAGLWAIPGMRIAIYWGLPYVAILVVSGMVVARRSRTTTEPDHAPAG